jgi:3-phytase
MSFRTSIARTGVAPLLAAIPVAILLSSCGEGPQSFLASDSTTITPTAETESLPAGGDADDPAIWIDQAAPARSTIIGTDKEGGIAVYDLAGKQLQYRADGDLNNVDLRDPFPLGGMSVALVTAADRTTNRLAIYRVDPATRRLVDVAARRIVIGLNAYGSCMYRSSKSGKFYVFVNSEEEGAAPGGEVEQWQLFDAGGGKVDARRVRRFAVGSQTEGCVADDDQGYLYIGEEDKAIWRYGAEPDAGTQRTRIDKTGSGGHLEADIEGLAIAAGTDGSGYLIASSQGNSSFSVYRREDGNEYVKTFKVAPEDGVDGAEETDGIDATTRDLGDAFSEGLLVVQDGKPDRGTTNFKLVPLGGET